MNAVTVFVEDIYSEEIKIDVSKLIHADRELLDALTGNHGWQKEVYLASTNSPSSPEGKVLGMSDTKLGRAPPWWNRWASDPAIVAPVGLGEPEERSP